MISSLALAYRVCIPIKKWEKFVVPWSHSPRVISINERDPGREKLWARFKLPCFDYLQKFEKKSYFCYDYGDLRRVLDLSRIRGSQFEVI